MGLIFKAYPSKKVRSIENCHFIQISRYLFTDISSHQKYDLDHHILKEGLQTDANSQNVYTSMQDNKYRHCERAPRHLTNVILYSVPAPQIHNRLKHKKTAAQTLITDVLSLPCDSGAGKGQSVWTVSESQLINDRVSVNQ